MKKMFLSLLLILASCTLSFANDETLSVSGTGRVTVKPDSAVVRLGVETRKETASLAQNDNAKIMAKIIETISSLDIKKENVQTLSFNIWPEINYGSGKAPVVTGYRASNQLNILVADDLSKISKVIDRGIEAGANQVLGITFAKNDDSSAKKEALSLAVKDAEYKAETIANSAKVKIIGIQKIIEGEGPATYQNVDGVRFLGTSGKGSGAPTPVEEGSIDIVKNISIVYLIKK